MTRRIKDAVYRAAMRALWSERTYAIQRSTCEAERRNAVAEFKAALTYLQASYARW